MTPTNHENMHPNLYSASPARSNKLGLAEPAKMDLLSSPPVGTSSRLSTLSHRLSTYSGLEDSFYTAAEPSSSPRRRRTEQRGESLLGGLCAVAKLQEDVLALSQQLAERDAQLAEAVQTCDALRARSEEAENRSGMLQAEIDCQNFFVAIQAQKIAELENAVSSNRLEYHESLASKNKKIKSLARRAEREKAEHDKRANLMIAQLNEQMTALQKLALTRIENLEKELMKERHKVQELELENRELQEENDHMLKELENLSDATASMILEDAEEDELTEQENEDEEEEDVEDEDQ